MFNERGMMSRSPSVPGSLWSWRRAQLTQPALAQNRQEGLAKLLWQRGPCAGQMCWHSKDLLPPCLLAAAVPCASLAQSCGRRGTCWHRGHLAPCLAPAWSTQPHSPAPWHFAWGGCHIHRMGRHMPAFAMSWALEL